MKTGLTDLDVIRTLWPKHYPERLTVYMSWVLCNSLCHMVEDRAGAIEDKIARWDKLAQALNQLGIPISQYDQVKSEQRK